jgi:hypothetical protein
MQGKRGGKRKERTEAAKRSLAKERCRYGARLKANQHRAAQSLKAIFFIFPFSF